MTNLVTKVLGPVAQRLEQGTHNPLVVGSNPTGPTTLTSSFAIGKFFVYRVLSEEYFEGLSSRIFRKATFLKNDSNALEMKKAKG